MEADPRGPARHRRPLPRVYLPNYTLAFFLVSYGTVGVANSAFYMQRRMKLRLDINTQRLERRAQPALLAINMVITHVPLDIICVSSNHVLDIRIREPLKTARTR